MMEEIVSQISNLLERTHIFRGDSAFYDGNLRDFLESNQFLYYIRAKNMHSVVNTSQNHSLEQDIDITQYTPMNPFYGSVAYKMTGSDVTRKLVYKAYCVEENEQLSLYRLYIVSSQMIGIKI